MIRTIFFLVVGMFMPSISNACAEIAWSHEQKVASLNSQEDVVVLRVLTAKQSTNEMYRRTLRIEAGIEQVLKGNLQTGDIITANHADDFHDPGCPVLFSEGYFFLVPLLKVEGDYRYSSDSYIIGEKASDFGELVKVLSKD